LGQGQQPVEVWRLSSPPLGALAPLQVFSALIQPTCFQQVQAERVGRQPSPTVAWVCWRPVEPELAVLQQQQELLRLAKQGPF
jgi:hypothetical protein